MPWKRECVNQKGAPSHKMEKCTFVGKQIEAHRAIKRKARSGRYFKNPVTDNPRAAGDGVKSPKKS